MLQLRYATHLVRSRGRCGRRAAANSAKAISVRKASSNALTGTTGVRATAWGERIGRVNWGPSAAGGLVAQPDGIIHKPLGGRQRRRCGHSKRRAGRTIQPAGEPRATGLAVVVRSSRCRLVARPATDKPPGNEIPTVMAYKQALKRPRRWPWRQAGLKPYWGKPAVRNFRGGRGNEVDGLMTVCHDARKGRYIGSHGPNHVRASALLDGSEKRIQNGKAVDRGIRGRDARAGTATKERKVRKGRVGRKFRHPAGLGGYSAAFPGVSSTLRSSTQRRHGHHGHNAWVFAMGYCYGGRVAGSSTPAKFF